MTRAVSVALKGRDKLLEALKRLPRETKGELRVEMKRFTRDVRVQSTRGHRFTARSGNLERSVKSEVSRDGTEGQVYLDTGIAHYGPWLHDGTDPFIIQANRAKALRFVSGGRFVFAKRVRHPGIKPDQFVYNAFDRLSPSLSERMDGAYGRIIEKAGL